MASVGTKGDLQLDAEQLRVLEENFSERRHPHPAALMLIAAECGLSEEDTAKWFRQRNAQWRQAEGLPPEPGSVKD